MHPARLKDRDCGNLTYKIVRFEYSDGRATFYLGIAWNYDIPALLSTSIPADTYTQAREWLERGCAANGYSLRWFDGEYVSRDGGDFLVSVSTEERV